MANEKPVALPCTSIPPRSKKTVYPEPFASQMERREKRQLGDFFGLKNFGVNLTRIEPGGKSALFHRHTKQDEFIYVVEGTPTLVTDSGETLLEPEMCAGFPAGGTAHQLVNRSDRPVVYLEVGDRTPGDEATYPNDDLKATQSPSGEWLFTHKNGTPY